MIKTIPLPDGGYRSDWRTKERQGYHEVPLFAHPFPPLTKEQASGKPVGRRADHGQKQDIRFGDDDPNASGLLKTSVSPTRAALRPSTLRDFQAGY